MKAVEIFVQDYIFGIGCPSSVLVCIRFSGPDEAFSCRATFCCSNSRPFNAWRSVGFQTGAFTPVRNLKGVEIANP